MADRPAAYEIIYAVIRLIPRGRVATYGQIAQLAGLGRRARMVGRSLRFCAVADAVPWQRVVNGQGRVSTGSRGEGRVSLQRRLLEKEGVEFSPAGRIELDRFVWDPGPEIVLPRAAGDTRADRGVAGER